MSVTTYIFSAEGCSAVENEMIPQLLVSEQVFWVDMIVPSPESVRLLREVFNFHPLAVEDALHQEQRSKVEEYHEHLFVVINSVSLVQGKLIARELDIFVGRNFCVTVHKHEEPAIYEVRRRLQSGVRASRASSGLILHTVLDVIVDSYFPILDRLTDQIEAAEDRVLRRSSETLLADLMHLKQTVRALLRSAQPTQTVVSFILHHDRMFADRDSLHYYFRDVSDHLLRVVESCTHLRETLSNTLELYVSAASNRLNHVVNRLAVITVAIGVISVFTGFYGMNFEQTFPPFDDPNGIPKIVLVMLAAEIIVLAFFRWRKWL
ncbi:MAG: magnesium/cobalt transporter CorA [Anaerolineae bacterium]|nr:magnesium/cobalt transporter CorA [Anaerolineae bacterium]